MIPHSISLRHPWQAESAGQQMRYRRMFNRPTNLDPWERVSLEIDRAMFCGEVSINGSVLGLLTVGEYFAADVTTLLEDRNELVVHVDPQTAAASPPPTSTIYAVAADQPTLSPIGDVKLVIRATRAH